MTIDERLIADYGDTGINIGCHPMFYHRAEMNALGVTTAAGLASLRSGKHAWIAGCVRTPEIRNRKGIVFLGVEDETGIANVVVMPDIFDANRLLIVSTRWLMIEGQIQNVDNVIHVRAKRIQPLGFSPVPIPSHDFH
jgi:error-prone DNA polymerase